MPTGHDTHADAALLRPNTAAASTSLSYCPAAHKLHAAEPTPACVPPGHPEHAAVDTLLALPDAHAAPAGVARGWARALCVC